MLAQAAARGPEITFYAQEERLLSNLVIHESPCCVLLWSVLHSWNGLTVLVVERNISDHLPSRPASWRGSLPPSSKDLPVFLVRPSRVSHVQLRLQLEVDVVALVQIGDVLREPDSLHVGSPSSDNASATYSSAPPQFLHQVHNPLFHQLAKENIARKQCSTSTVRRTSMVTTSGSCLGSLVSMWIIPPSSTSTVFTTCPNPTIASVNLIRIVNFT